MGLAREADRAGRFSDVWSAELVLVVPSDAPVGQPQAFSRATLVVHPEHALLGASSGNVGPSGAVHRALNDEVATGAGVGRWQPEFGTIRADWIGDRVRG